MFIENCIIHQAKFAIHCKVSFRYERLNMEPDSPLLINIMISLSALWLAYKYIFCSNRIVHS